MLNRRLMLMTAMIGTSQVPGEGTESIYERIDETHDGSKYDPIPYDGNMELKNRKVLHAERREIHLYA